MKPLIVALFVSSLFLAVHAAENPVENAPAKDTAVSPPAAAPKADEKSVSTPAPAATEAKTTPPDDVKKPEEIAAPATTSTAATDSKDTVFSSTPVVSTVSAPSPAEVPPAIEVKKVETVPPPSVGFAAPLQTLVAFHEKEIASLKQTMTQWETKVGPVFQRRRDLEQSLKANLEKVEELKKLNTKASKKEANSLKKEISETKKGLSSVEKEISAQRKVLIAETRDASRVSERLLKDYNQHVTAEIEALQK
ncbi:MAG: hypothetical protein IPP35_00300 [Elusimicrobia bacterium]|nr:hypothetical protein [Elusimicrobiota bacterium]